MGFWGDLTLLMGSSINSTPKRYILAWKQPYVQAFKIGPLVRPVRVTKKPKKTKNPNSGKLGIRPDHPHRRIEMQFCMVGGLWMVVLSFKFDQTRLSGYRDFIG